MKTHKEVAEELVRKNLIIISKLEIIYGNNIDFDELKLDKNFKVAIKCAKIAVDEIIKIQVLRSTMIASKIDGYLESDSSEYWQELKNELNNMS